MNLKALLVFLLSGCKPADPRDAEWHPYDSGGKIVQRRFRFGVWQFRD